jgi:hypothetical protein
LNRRLALGPFGVWSAKLQNTGETVIVDTSLQWGKG